MEKIFFKNRKRRVKKDRGFTLVELLVVFFIMGAILAVIVPDYITHSTQLELENLALDVALVLREAQSYGSGAKVSSLENFDTSYGVHFVRGYNEIIFFEDSSGGDYERYTSADKVITRYAIKGGYSISDIEKATGNGRCVLDVIYKRPNPDAIIKPSINDPCVGSSEVDMYTGRVSYAIITLLSPDQKVVKIVVNNTGNTSVY